MPQPEVALRVRRLGVDRRIVDHVHLGFCPGRDGSRCKHVATAAPDGGAAGPDKSSLALHQYINARGVSSDDIHAHPTWQGRHGSYGRVILVGVAFSAGIIERRHRIGDDVRPAQGGQQKRLKLRVIVANEHRDLAEFRVEDRKAEIARRTENIVVTHGELVLAVLRNKTLGADHGGGVEYQPRVEVPLDQAEGNVNVVRLCDLAEGRGGRTGNGVNVGASFRRRHIQEAGRSHFREDDQLRAVPGGINRHLHHLRNVVGLIRKVKRTCRNLDLLGLDRMCGSDPKQHYCQQRHGELLHFCLSLLGRMFDVRLHADRLRRRSSCGYRLCRALQPVETLNNIANIRTQEWW